MTIYVWMPGGKLHVTLGRVEAIRRQGSDPKRKLMPGVKPITQESGWRRTDFYCTSAGLTATLELLAMRLHADIVHLPRHRHLFSEQLADRQARKVDSWVRWALPEDLQTMPALMPPETLDMFPELTR